MLKGDWLAGAPDAWLLLTHGVPALERLQPRSSRQRLHAGAVTCAARCPAAARWESGSAAGEIKQLQQRLSVVFNLPEGAWERR